MALTLMNARFAHLLAGEADRWALAGDQLYVDLDLSTANLPPGSRLTVGEAVIEITDQPHKGCAKFRRRFGADALRYVNAPEGRRLNLRGVNARVLEGGWVGVGDTVAKTPAV
jgi:MOSC domain-containing protein YiiM